MKVKPTLFLLAFFTLFLSKANATPDQEEPSSDFLEFLAEMEEVTGDGFDNWLDTETEYETDNHHTEHQTKNYENEQY